MAGRRHINVGIALLVALAAPAVFAQPWSIKFTANDVANPALPDKGVLEIGTDLFANDGLDILDDPQPATFPRETIDLFVAHQQSDPGWEGQAFPQLLYRKMFLAPLTGGHIIPMHLYSDTARSVKISWGGVNLLEETDVSRYFLWLHVGATTYDLWTSPIPTLSLPAGITELSLEIAPGRATRPVVVDTTFTADEDVPITIRIPAHDYDSCEITFALTYGPFRGSISPLLNEPCVPGVPNRDGVTFTYTPNRDNTAADLFNIRATDSTGRNDTATITINFNGINDAPVAFDQAIVLSEDVPLSFVMSYSDVDNTNPQLTATFVAPPQHGTIVLESAGSKTYRYSPDRNYVGTDRLLYQVSDGALASRVATLDVTVNAIDGPVSVLSTPDEVGVGETFVADGSGSFHRFPPKTIVSYAFDFGDGTTYTETASSAPDGAFDGMTTHAFTEVGTKTVALTTVDSASPSKSDIAMNTIKVPGTDLGIDDVDVSGLRYDGQALTVRGIVTARVTNLGAIPVDRSFDVAFFEDRDLDGAFGAGDVELGRTTVESLGFVERRIVGATLVGSVMFAENQVHAFVDADGAIAETHEENNVAACGAGCLGVGPTQTIDPVTLWFKNQFTISPTNAAGSDASPTVVDLNGDGVKDIVWVGEQYPAGTYRAGWLRAISGVDGAELWQVPHTTDNQSTAGSVPAAADIDGDGLPEIIVRRYEWGVMVVEHDGTIKWKTSFVESTGNNALADLDGDGVPEIVHGRLVLNADGTTRWHGTAPVYSDVSVVADLDLDGRPEVIVGPSAYSATGDLLWVSPMATNGRKYAAAIANVDDDPYPEIVITEDQSGRVWMLEHDGTQTWGPVQLACGWLCTVGPPSIADIDGDGRPEIAVASSPELRLMTADGATIWTTGIVDHSGRGIASIFDLDGDGSLEVIFADEVATRFLRGSDGAVLTTVPRWSHTASDQVTVTDLDGDGQAEIVVGQNGPTTPDNGIQVLGPGPGTSWVGCRGVWNEATYHITNIDDGLTVPALEANSWQFHNTFLQQESYGYRRPDVVPSYVRAVDAAGIRTLTARVGNGGFKTIPAGIAIAFYEGDPGAGGTLLGVATTAAPIAPGAYEDVDLVVALGTGTAVFVWADHDGGGAEQISECNEGNNLYDSTRTSTNGAPVAMDDAYAATEDVVLTVPGPGPLANDTDPDGDRMMALVEVGPSHGTVALRGDGELVYTPAADYNGIDSFTYRATDGELTSDPATVTFTIGAINDAPVGDGQSVTTSEDATLPITLTGSDVDGDSITFSIVTAPARGTLTGAPPNVEYAASPDLFGPDSFTFKVNDGTLDSNETTVSIWVTAVNDAPVAEDQSIQADEDAVTTLLLGASDIDGDPLTFIVVTGPTHGSLQGNGPVRTYAPAFDYVGPDSFTFKVNDGHVDSNVAAVSITVVAVNHAPVAHDQTGSTLEDTPLALTLTAADVDSDPLTFIIEAAPLHGTLSGTPPAVTYTPEPEYAGTDFFTFKANDGALDSNVATVSLYISTVNDPPIAYDQPVTVPEDSEVALVLTGSDAEGQPLSFSLVDPPQHGVLLGVLPNVTYRPTADYFGGDLFTFRVNDGHLHSNAATVGITVTPVNDAPIAFDQLVTMVEDGSRVLTLQATDPDDDPLIYTIVSGPTHGTLSGAAPDVTYTPAADYSGPDSFVFRANDGLADSNDATVSLTVIAVNDAPVASDQSLATDEDQPLGVALQATDADGNPLIYAVLTAPTHGTLSGTAPALVYTPAADYNGADAFTFRANDGLADSNVATVSITVNPVNDAPVAQDRAVSTDEGQAVSFTLDATDVEGDALSFTVTSAPTHGTLSGAAPALTYTPDVGFSGTDTLTFTASDGQLPSNTGTVTITVAPNTAPVTSDLAVSTEEDTDLPITLQATDADNDPLSYGIVSQPTNGTLSGPPPNVIYHPAQNWNGVDTFTYRATDGKADSNLATVTITVVPVNDAPVASDGSASTSEDTDASVTVQATDVDGDSLTYAITTAPTHGTLTGVAPALTYHPEADWNGVDSFTFQANDGQVDSNLATVTITVTAVNDAPVASDQTLSTDEDTPLPLTLQATDVDGDGLTYTVISGSGPTHGTLSGTAPNLIYTPSANYFGTDAFSFQASDGSADSNVATVTITINPINDAPVAQDQSVSTPEAQAVAIVLQATDAEGSTLTYAIVNGPGNGTLSGTAPNVSYEPGAGFSGTDTFTFTASDGQLTSSPATVTITVVANYPPVASDQAVSTDEDTAVTVTLQATDADTDPLTFAIVTAPANGTLTGVPPNMTYQPAADWYGADTFTFKANDGKADSNVATVTITVNPVNDAPVAHDGAATTAEDTDVALVLTASDVDGDPLSFTIETGPAHGTLSGAAPTLTYHPEADWNGVDTFTFQASDGQAGSSATFTITVTPVNDAPVAAGQTPSTDEDTPRPLTLQASDVDGDSLTYIVLTGPTQGTLTGTGSNRVYTPAPDWSGVDVITFKANDGQADSNVATVTITVNPVNDAPVAQDRSVATDEGQPVSFTLEATDVEGDALSYTVTTNPVHGTLTGTAPDLTYTPATGFSGTDTLTFTASDGQLGSNQATVTITVAPNTAPVADDQAVSTNEDTAVAITLTATDTDGDPLAYTLVSQPANGTLSGSAPNLTYQPAADWNGIDTFTFRASDGKVDSNVATVTITVVPVNDAPVATDGSASTLEDTDVPVVLQATDVDGDLLAYGIVTAPQHGTLSGTAPDLTFSPEADGSGVDTFTWKASDSALESNVATFTITVTAVNDAPVAGDRQVTTDEDLATPITLVATDAEGDAITYTVVNPPAEGTLTGTAPSLVYTPGADWNGVDTFTYTASDGQNTSNVATVTITVRPINDAPVASDQSITVQAGTSTPVTLVATDVDGDVLTYAVDTGPTHGTLSGSPPTLTYTPGAGFSGTDSFTFTASDGQLGSNVGMVSITVTGQVNQAPICTGAAATPVMLWPPNHKMKTIQVIGVTDPDGDPVTITVTSVRQDEPVNGLGDGDTSPDATVSPLKVRSERSGTGDGRVYHIDFNGSDAQGGTCSGIVTVCVPHDQGSGTCGDQGASYDSTQQ